MERRGKRYCPLCGNPIEAEQEVVVIDKGVHRRCFRYSGRLLPETHKECLNSYFNIDIEKMCNRGRRRRNNASLSK